MSRHKPRLFLNDVAMLSACGNHRDRIFQNIIHGDRSGLRLSDAYALSPSYVGEIKADLVTVPDGFELYNCKNNQLLLTALADLKPGLDAMLKRFGHDRIGVVLGTSTSGVRNTEQALELLHQQHLMPTTFHYKQQQLGAGADLLAQVTCLTGPAYTLSTACSSSGKAFSSARRLIELDLCDAVIVGGADTLCRFTAHGFGALEAVADEKCKPFGQHRDGINLSEAVTLFILSREPGPVELKGIGVSCDAYHFSAPDPDAQSVMVAMRSALEQAGIKPQAVDYINLHGTATVLNDAMESQAVKTVFGSQTPISSSKGMTGHALGAAAALELGLCWMLLTQEKDQPVLIPNMNEDIYDTRLPKLNFVECGQYASRPLQYCQSNSFAFGGNNVSLLISRT